MADDWPTIAYLSLPGHIGPDRKVFALIDRVGGFLRYHGEGK